MSYESVQLVLARTPSAEPPGAAAIRLATARDGVVTRVIDAHKVEVLFRDEARTLAQAMA